MKILVVDDDKQRQKVFARNLISNEVVIKAFTYDEAIEALIKHSPFDIVFLDHDLGLTDDYKSIKIGDYGEEIELTGADIASFIAELDEKPKKVVVHSYNPDGAKRILNILKDTNIELKRELFHTDITA